MVREDTARLSSDDIVHREKMAASSRSTRQERLARAMYKVPVAPNEVLIRQGDAEADHAYVVAAGEFEVVTASKSADAKAQPRVVGRLGENGRPRERRDLVVVKDRLRHRVPRALVARGVRARGGHDLDSSRSSRSILPH